MKIKKNGRPRWGMERNDNGKLKDTKERKDLISLIKKHPNLKAVAIRTLAKDYMSKPPAVDTIARLIIDVRGD